MIKYTDLQYVCQRTLLGKMDEAFSEEWRGKDKYFPGDSLWFNQIIVLQKASRGPAG